MIRPETRGAVNPNCTSKPQEDELNPKVTVRRRGDSGEVTVPQV